MPLCWGELFLGWLFAIKIKIRLQKGDRFEAASGASERGGLLFASGLITGEALIGILLALPVAIYGRSDVFALLENEWPSVVGLIIVLGVTYWLYAIGKKAFDEA